jgi:hypothetical protein
MDWAKGRANVSHEMSTSNVGSILPAERGNVTGPMAQDADPNDANCFDLPSDCSTDAGGNPN